MSDETKYVLEELARTTMYSDKYKVSRTNYAKKLSKTEINAYNSLEKESDLGYYSNGLIYSPFFKYVDKNGHKAIIKLIKRGYLIIITKVIPVCEKYPDGKSYNVMVKVKGEKI